MKAAFAIALATTTFAGFAHAQGDADPDTTASDMGMEEGSDTGNASAGADVSAGGDAAAGGGAADEGAAAAKPKAKYSLPWQLRPTGVATVLRSDTAVMLYKPKGGDESGNAIATTLLFAYKLTPEIGPLIRVGYVNNSPPDPGESAGAFMNPALGVTWAPKLGGPIRIAAFLGVALPLGSNGGNDPDAAKSAALRTGIRVRSSMDNAMFAVNDLTVFPGFGVAYVADNLTVQGEVTVLQLTRVKGDDVQEDSSKTNFTSGIHVGYFVIPMLAISAELRHQRWLSTPSFVEADEASGGPDTGARDDTTVAIGPRFHFKLGGGMGISPGIAYARHLDGPVTETMDSHHIFQIDIPVKF